MLLIKNGYVLDPRSGRQGKKDLLLKDGRIERMGNVRDWQDVQILLEKQRQQPGLAKETEEKRVSVYDAEGLTAAPGLLDVHVHFRDPGFLYKEDIESGSRAAARGGFTTVVLMANTKPVVDNEETLSYVLEKGGRQGIHVESCAAITRGLRGEELVDMEGLQKMGAVGFTDDGIPLLQEALVRRAMEKAAALSVPLSFHEENPAFIQDNGVNSGVAARLGLGGSGREAEIDMVRRDVKLALETGARVNIQHISSREAVELVRQARRAGADVHAEASPHHFTLTEEAVLRCGTLAKMNPPLREEADRLAIIEGLRDGTIDLIATDHAPHAKAEKDRPLAEAPSGIIGLETALSLGITELVEKGELSLMELLAKLTWNPARLYGMNRGYIAEGGPADLVLFDREAVWTVAEQFASKSANSPFVGWQLKGLVRCTICNGEKVYES